MFARNNVYFQSTLSKCHIYFTRYSRFEYFQFETFLQEFLHEFLRLRRFEGSQEFKFFTK